MRKYVRIQNINLGIVLHPRRLYKLLIIDNQGKRVISPLFKGRDYLEHIPERKDRTCYEIQRVRYRAGTHKIKE